jgi:hypothetical protein
MNRTLEGFLDTLPKDVAYYLLHSDIPEWKPEKYLEEKNVEKFTKFWRAINKDKKFWVEVVYVK